MSQTNDTKEIPKGDFPVILNLVDQHQRKDPILMAKYKEGIYHKCYVRGGSNIGLNLITCEDNLVIP